MWRRERSKEYRGIRGKYVLIETKGNEERRQMTECKNPSHYKRVKSWGCNKRVLMDREGGKTAGDEIRKVERRRWY